MVRLRNLARTAGRWPALTIAAAGAHAGLARLGAGLTDHAGAGVDAILVAADYADRFRLLVERRRWLEEQLDVGSPEQRLRSTLLVLAPVFSGLGSYLVG